MASTERAKGLRMDSFYQIDVCTAVANLPVCLEAFRQRSASLRSNDESSCTILLNGRGPFARRPLRIVASIMLGA